MSDPGARGAICVTAVGAVEEDVMRAAETAAWLTFAREIRRLPGRPEPAAALDAARGQWSSSVMLADAARAAPPDALRLLAVTEVDLFIPMLSFVFGQAQLGGRAAIVSTARLRPEFHGLPPNRGLLLARLAKEVIHELGHTFGLVHCGTAACPMSLSTMIRQVDVKGSELCAGCLLELKRSAARSGGSDRPGSRT